MGSPSFEHPNATWFIQMWNWNCTRREWRKWKANTNLSQYFDINFCESNTAVSIWIRFTISLSFNVSLSWVSIVGDSIIMKLYLFILFNQPLPSLYILCYGYNYVYSVAYIYRLAWRPPPQALNLNDILENEGFVCNSAVPGIKIYYRQQPAVLDRYNKQCKWMSPQFDPPLDACLLSTTLRSLHPPRPPAVVKETRRDPWTIPHCHH